MAWITFLDWKALVAAFGTPPQTRVEKVRQVEGNKSMSVTCPSLEGKVKIDPSQPTIDKACAQCVAKIMQNDTVVFFLQAIHSKSHPKEEKLLLVVDLGLKGMGVLCLVLWEPSLRIDTQELTELMVRCCKLVPPHKQAGRYL